MLYAEGHCTQQRGVEGGIGKRYPAHSAGLALQPASGLCMLQTGGSHGDDGSDLSLVLHG